eukprot:1160141-Pelagomonas_calceolata.AAC.10
MAAVSGCIQVEPLVSVPQLVDVRHNCPQALHSTNQAVVKCSDGQVSAFLRAWCRQSSSRQTFSRAEGQIALTQEVSITQRDGLGLVPEKLWRGRMWIQGFFHSGISSTDMKELLLLVLTPPIPGITKSSSQGIATAALLPQRVTAG